MHRTTRGIWFIFIFTRVKLVYNGRTEMKRPERKEQSWMGGVTTTEVGMIKVMVHLWCISGADAGIV